MVADVDGRRWAADAGARATSISNGQGEMGKAAGHANWERVLMEPLLAGADLVTALLDLIGFRGSRLVSQHINARPKSLCASASLGRR